MTTHLPPQPVAVLPRNDGVHVVRHEAAGADPEARPRRRFAQPAPVQPVIGLLEERRFAPIAALRDVVRDAGNDEAGHPRTGDK